MANALSVAETVASLPVQGEDDRKAVAIITALTDERRVALSAAGNLNADLGAIFAAAKDLIRRYDRTTIVTFDD